MATASTLINRALRLIGQLASGASPTSDESSDALVALNDMVEAWKNERLLVYALQEESLSLSDGTASYTIGPSGSPSLNTIRPIDIEEAWIVASNTSYPVKKMQDEEYAAIPDKTTESDWPEYFLYRPSMANGTLIVYPVPNATRTMKLLTRVPVSEFAAVGTTVSLPPGWQRALTYNLALEIAPEYDTAPSAEVVHIARESKAWLKRNNHRPILSRRELSFVGGSRSNILADQP